MILKKFMNLWLQMKIGMKIQKNMETKTVLMEVKLFIQFIKPIIRLRVCICDVGHQLILEQKSERKPLFTTTYIAHS